MVYCRKCYNPKLSDHMIGKICDICYNTSNKNIICLYCKKSLDISSCLLNSTYEYDLYYCSTSCKNNDRCLQCRRRYELECELNKCI